MRRLNQYLLILLLLACNSESKINEKIFDQSLERVDNQIEVSKRENKLPRSLDRHKYLWAQETWDWTEGFFPGICWLSYEYTNDIKYLEAAEFFQDKFKSHRFYTFSHDLGFVFNNSYGKAYKLTGNKEYKSILTDAGNTLIKRFDSDVGCLQSWNVEGVTEGSWLGKRGWDYPVIIDNMMNLELLFDLTSMTGDSTYYNIAVTHANTTLQHHFRSDFSSYHVVNYNKETGEVISKETAQGYSDESAWARGQAWGLYGFTVAYRYTKDDNYLSAAENIAEFILTHPQLPKDKIPYWDFNAPKIPHEPRDASAAAIMASALIELDMYSDNNYEADVDKLLESLSSSKYMFSYKDNNGFILKHSVGSIPHNSDIDMPIIYADYYFLEALQRSSKSSAEMKKLFAYLK